MSFVVNTSKIHLFENFTKVVKHNDLGKSYFCTVVYLFVSNIIYDQIVRALTKIKEIEK